jgi:hypothetical protein
MSEVEGFAAEVAWVTHGGKSKLEKRKENVDHGWNVLIIFSYFDSRHQRDGHVQGA